MSMEERTKNTRKKSAFRIGILFIACAIAVVCIGPKRADSLLTSQDIDMTHIYWFGEDGATGETLYIKAEQPAMDALLDFLRNTRIMWCGIHGKPESEGYTLVNLNGKIPLGIMSVTKSGHLYCGDSVYRVITPASGNMWQQLEALYASVGGAT